MRSFILLAIFCIDVRVHAETHASESKDCWGHKVPCAIRNEAGVRHLKSERFEISLDKGALLEQRETSVVHFVTGLFYLRHVKGAEFTTAFAKFNCKADCQALIERQDDKMTLKVLEGQVWIKRLGEEKYYRVDAGLQVSVSEVAEDGKAAMEFPQSLPWLTTAKDWARLFPGEVEDFHKELAEFRTRWNEAVESASETHKLVADRQIAAHNEELAKQKARAAAAAREDQRLRELFRRKNNFD